MGDLIRNVTLCALSPDGERGECREYRAIIDTGASRCVVPRRVVRELGATPFRDISMRLGRRRYPTVLLSVQLDAPDCEEQAAVAIVSDALARKARPRAEIILGHDYLQAEQVALAFTAPRHKVFGTAGRRSRRRR